jgi:hypothetical protein
MEDASIARVGVDSAGEETSPAQAPRRRALARIVRRGTVRRAIVGLRIRMSSTFEQELVFLWFWETQRASSPAGRPPDSVKRAPQPLERCGMTDTGNAGTVSTARRYVVRVSAVYPSWMNYRALWPECAVRMTDGICRYDRAERSNLMHSARGTRRGFRQFSGALRWIRRAAPEAIPRALARRHTIREPLERRRVGGAVQCIQRRRLGDVVQKTPTSYGGTSLIIELSLVAFSASAVSPARANLLVIDDRHARQRQSHRLLRHIR